MRLFFDFETTGKLERHSGPDDPRQPVPVQAAMYLETDSENVVRVSSYLIDPESWPGERVRWDPDAERVHGIPREVARAYGVSAQHLANDLMSMLGHATLTIAHNIEFDVRIADVAFHRLGMPRLPWPTQFCTMLRSVPIVKKPGRRVGEFGWPKLAEAYHFFTKKELSGAHDALVDVYACRAVFRGIQRTLAQAAVSPPEAPG
jgi:DNA polymerase-3 subunit epsilon